MGAGGQPAKRIARHVAVVEGDLAAAFELLALLVALAGDQDDVTRPRHLQRTLDRGAAVGFDLHRGSLAGRGCCLGSRDDRGDDRIRLLRARVVRRDDGVIGEAARGSAHQRPLVAVAVPAGPEHNDQAAVVELMRGHASAISCVNYWLNERLARAAVEAGTHFCDLGGNNDVVDAELALDAEARAAGVNIVPDCGLAPGMVAVLAAHGALQFETLDAIHIRVGGLPQTPKPPLDYQMVFSVEGLINEYIEPARVIRDGKVTIVDSMTERERFNHMIINGARRRRIAKGSGTSVQEVNNLLKQYAQMRKMMKSFSGGGFLGKKLGKLKLPMGFGS